MYFHMTQSLLNLHKMGYIHNDIGMHNWITQPGSYSIPKLIDFGKSIYNPMYAQNLGKDPSNKDKGGYQNQTNRDIRRLGRTFEKIKRP